MAYLRQSALALSLSTLLIGCGGSVVPLWSDGSGNGGVSDTPADAGASSRAPDGSTPPSALVDGGGASDDAPGLGWSDASSVTDDTAPVASCYQLNPQHTGAIEDSALAQPLHRIWDIDLGAQPSFPLIARGLVYLTANGAVQAVDRKTGTRVWGPMTFGDGHSDPLQQAYEAGRLYVSSSSGILKAYDAASGKELWSTNLVEPFDFFDSPPTAYRGAVYVSGDGMLYAVDGLTGTIVWQQPVDGTSSAPTVLDDAVYVSYACAVSQSFDRLSGAQRWKYFGSCSGGGANMASLVGGKLYAQDGSGGFDPDTLILDPTTGSVLGHTLKSSASYAAYHASQAFFTSSDGSLYAEDLGTHARPWSILRDGGTIVMTTPIVAGGRVFVGTIDGGGKADVRALDEHTGVTVWSDDLSAYFHAGEDFGSAMALAAAEGTLVVPAMTHLIGYSAATVPVDH